MAPSFAQRSRIATDTLERIEAILHAVPEGSLDSTFIKGPELPPLTKISDEQTTTISVINSDAFTAARDIMRRFPDARGKTAVLNLASDLYRAGGWTETLSCTQEEALCYSSTLYHTLKEEYYPWANEGPASIAGIYSPSVVIFKDDLDHDCVDLAPEERRVVSVITVAALRSPPLTADGEAFAWPASLNDMREKIRLVYRMAAHNAQEHIVLGAMGCGAYQCPTRQVAEEMKSILLDEEFRGRFRTVVFAVYSTGRNNNYEVFKEVLDGVKV